MKIKEKIKSLGTRQSQVFAELVGYQKGITASELAKDMHEIGFFLSSDRNNVQPRLREMELDGIVEIIGKRQCSVTNKTVNVYKVSSRALQSLQGGF